MELSIRWDGVLVKVISLLRRPVLLSRYHCIISAMVLPTCLAMAIFHAEIHDNFHRRLVVVENFFWIEIRVVRWSSIGSGLTTVFLFELFNLLNWPDLLD